MSTTGQNPRGSQRETPPIESSQTTGYNGTPNSSGPLRGGYGGAPAGRRRNPFLIPGLVIGGLVLIAFIAVRHNASSQGGGSGGGKGAGGKGKGDDNAKTANYVRAELGSIQAMLTVTGTLRANQDINLSSKISGRVARITVNEGDRVRRGQLVISLENDDLKAQVAQAQANLNASQVRYQQTVLGIPARVAQVNATIVQAQSQLQTAQARYRQAVLNQPLRSQTAQSGLRQARETVKQAQTRVQQARETAQQADLTSQAQIRSAAAGVTAAQANLADVRRGSREQQIAAQQQQVKILEAQLANANIELQRQQTLVTGGAAPQSALDTARTQRDVVSAQLEAARQNLSLVIAGNTNEQIQQAEQQVRQAQAQYAEAQAGRSTVINAQADITSALAQLTSARAAEAQAEANLATIPQAQEDVRAAHEAVGQAQSALQQAIANRSQIPVARADVPAAAAAVRQAAAQLQVTRVNLNNAQLFSPVDGVINTKSTDVGEAVTVGSALLDIVALNSVYFEAQVSQNDLARIQIGQPVQVKVPTVSQQPLSGNVAEIIPVADQRLRLFRLRVVIPRAPRTLTPGAFASGIITTQVTSNTIIVPTAAVQTDENDKSSAFVAVKEKGKLVARRRDVVLGTSQGEQIEILSGIKRGDAVLLNIGDIGEGDEITLADQPGLPGQQEAEQAGQDGGTDGSASTDSGSTGGGSTGGGSAGGGSTGGSGSTGGGTSGT